MVEVLRAHGGGGLPIAAGSGHRRGKLRAAAGLRPLWVLVTPGQPLSTPSSGYSQQARRSRPGGHNLLCTTSPEQLPRAFAIFCLKSESRGVAR